MSLANWAGNVTYRAVRVAQPASLDELRSLVASGSPVRALGTGHSFSDIADTTATLVRLSSLPASMEVSGSTATISAGLRYADIGEPLYRAGFALGNLASLPHISVAGAVATGTHGSGAALPNLSAAVVGLRLVGAGGSLLSLSQGDADFAGAVVSLGALGIVTHLTLRVEPTFDVAQEVRLDVPLPAVQAALDEVFGAAYSVSVFTDYASGLGDVWLKRRLDHGPGTSWSGGRAAETEQHPIRGVDPAACTPQLGVPGPWHERLPHFRPSNVPSVGDELQSEFFVDRTDAPAALDALRGIGDRVAPVLHISEIRTMIGDEQWLSPAHGRDSVAFHFTWIRDLASVLPVVALVEETLAPFGARPHWGKITTLDPAAILALYPRAVDFAALRRRLDPAGQFANAYTTALFPA